MVKRSPRFLRRPKDPGVDDGLVASAMTTLAFDVKEMNQKTQQRKSYEILPPEPQQRQQWCRPNRANGSSSNSNNSQYSNKDGGGDYGEETVVFFYGEGSRNECGTIAPTNNTTRTGRSSKTDFLKTTTDNNNSNKSKQMKSNKYNNDNEEETINFLYDSDGGNDDSAGDTLDTTTSVDGSEPDIFDSIWQQEEENNDYNAYHDDVSVCFVGGGVGMGQVGDGSYDGAD
jgi:hypothetical protein